MIIAPLVKKKKNLTFARLIGKEQYKRIFIQILSTTKKGQFLLKFLDYLAS